jgi:hypothetical protein
MQRLFAARSVCAAISTGKRHCASFSTALLFDDTQIQVSLSRSTSDNVFLVEILNNWKEILYHIRRIFFVIFLLLLIMSIAFLTYFYALNVVQRKCFSIRATEHCPSCGENRPDELFPTGLSMSNFFECFNVVFDFFCVVEI